MKGLLVIYTSHGHEGMRLYTETDEGISPEMPTGGGSNEGPACSFFLHGHAAARGNVTGAAHGRSGN